MSDMRAKFKLTEVKVTEYGETHSYTAVTDKPFDPEGISDDNTYSKFTPNAKCEMLITNPALFGKFKPGKKYYVDFTEAEE